MSKIRWIPLFLALGCGDPCWEKLNSIGVELSEATKSVDRSCSVDADCSLISSDLPCLSSCPVAVARSAEAEYARLRDSVGASCGAVCKGSLDCFKTPNSAKCRNARCVAE